MNFSPLIIGCMRLGKWGANMSTAQLSDFIDQCLELGLNDFDHADIYGNFTTEEDFGQVLKTRPELREKIQLTTKCGIKMVSPNRPYQIKSYDSGREHIMASVDNSLKFLHTDYLDVLLVHRPDFLMDVNEIADTFHEMKEAGKVKAFGVSNFTFEQFELLHQAFPLVTNQIEVSLLHLNAFWEQTLTQCQSKNIRPTAWSPLGGGKLFGTPEDEQSLRILRVADKLKEKYNCQLDQLLLAFVLKHPAGILPVLGTSKIERIKAALEATNIQLDKEDWYELWQASTGETIA